MRAGMAGKLNSASGSVSASRHNLLPRFCFLRCFLRFPFQGLFFHFSLEIVNADVKGVMVHGSNDRNGIRILHVNYPLAFEEDRRNYQILSKRFSIERWISSR